ncbi:diguanylate cyclase [Pseudothermotoga elfii]
MKKHENEKSSFFSLLLKNQVIFACTVIIGTFFAINLLLEKFYNKYVFEPVFESTVNYVSAYIDEWQRTVQTFDVSYKLFAAQLLESVGKELEEDFNVSDEYLTDFINSQTDIERSLYLEKANWYLIDPDGIIQRTNYATDLFLDLSKAVPRYWQSQLSSMEKGQVLLENLSFEVRTNRPRIFVYKKLSNDWILEIGFSIKPVLVEKMWKNLNNIIESSKYIEEIRLYSVSFLPFGHSVKLDEHEMENFSKVQSERDYFVESIGDSMFKLYKNWIPLTEEGKIDWSSYSVHFTVRALILLNFKELAPFKTQLIFIFSCAIVSAVLISVFINLRQFRRILLPIAKLLDRIEKFRNNPLAKEAPGKPESRIKEVYELERSFQEMQKSVVSQMISQKLANELLEQDLEKYKSEALIDSLTGLYNYRFLLRYRANLEDSQKRFVICFIDVDGLKDINDNYGHSVGDTVLKIIAEKLRAVIRKKDVALRIGGDEFAIIFDDADLNEAENVMRRIESALSDTKIDDVSGLKISISYGLAEGSVESQATFEEILKSADISMYRQKVSKKRD